MTAPGRIEQAFERARAEGRTAFIAFVTAGYPSVEATLAAAPALVEGGADIIELGIPFSDPIGEGKTIQNASFQALQAGVTPAVCLEVIRKLRASGVAVPLLCMGYYNTMLSYGIERFTRDAAEAGGDGFIVVDLPPEESLPLNEACHANNLRLIYLLAPTSTEERIKRVAQLASGFIYCVSVTGVTGAREELPQGLEAFISRVRRHSDLPIAVGFGISHHRHFEAVGRIADAAVVGSAIVDVMGQSGPSELVERVKQYAEVVTGRRRAST
jgi:tryptophan synthase alpha chain